MKIAGLIVAQKEVHANIAMKVLKKVTAVERMEKVVMETVPHLQLISSQLDIMSA